MPLSGKLWPLHLKPQNDELLSSWLVRLARANSVKVHTLCSSAWPDKSIWNRDIDKSADDEIIKALAEKTGVSYERVFQTTLKAYEGIVFEKHNPKGNTPWIMPVGVYHRTRRRYGLQYCPECLAQDEEPYFRRKWRLAFITICEIHCTLLWDHCPKCKTPVNFHRVRNDVSSITMCPFCGFDLREAKPRNIDCFRQIYLQHRLLKTVREGYVFLPGRQPVYSHLYFSVLHQLMRLLVSRKKAAKLRGRIRKYQKFPGLRLSLKGRVGRRNIESLYVSNRFLLLSMSAWLMTDWPYRFVTICRPIRLLSFDLLADMKNIPYWYWHAVYENLYEEDRHPSDLEIVEAIKYLKRRNINVGSFAISKVLGVKEIFRKTRQRLSDFRHNFNQ